MIMTNETPPQPAVTVEQADWDAAYAMLIGPRVAGGDGGTCVVRTPTLKQAAEAFARHRLAQQSATTGGEVPSGWRLVPVDASDEMLEAGSYGLGGGLSDFYDPTPVWSAMLAAAPTHPNDMARSYDERVRYEERILAAEMRAVRLKRLVRQPEDRGSYVGDTYYPVGGTEASHRWDGNAWQWLPEFEMEEDEA